jgi:hypothetical protein
VDRFACDWHRLATTDPKNPTAPIIAHFPENSKGDFVRKHGKYGNILHLQGI